MCKLLKCVEVAVEAQSQQQEFTNCVGRSCVVGHEPVMRGDSGVLEQLAHTRGYGEDNAQ